MVRVDGHWRSTGWVRAHIRHPHRPGADQVVLFSLGRVRLDPRDWWPGGEAPQCALAARPAPAGVALPSPRRPDDDAGGPLSRPGRARPPPR